MIQPVMPLVVRAVSAYAQDVFTSDERPCRDYSPAIAGRRLGG